MKNIFPVVVLGGILLWSISKPKSTSSKRQELTKILRLNDEGTDVITQMSDAEIDDVYEYIMNYVSKGRKLPEQVPLYARIKAIGIKYNIFT